MTKLQFLLFTVLLPGSLLISPLQRSTRAKRQVSDDFCRQRMDAEIYPDPLECESYIYCSGGYAYRSTCSPGLYYYHPKKQCEFNNGQCRNGLGESSPEFPRGGNEIPRDRQTPEPTRDTGSDRAVLGKFCSERTDGTYASPLSCRSYVLCSNSAAYEAECPNGLVFSDDIGGCDFDYDGKCGAETMTDTNKSETTKPIYGGDSSGRGDGGGRGCEVRADATYTIPEHKACKNCWHSKADYTFSNTVDDDEPTFFTRPDVSMMPGLGESILTSMPAAIERAMLALTTNMQEEARMARDMDGSSRPFKLVQRFLRAKPLAKQLSMSAFVLQNASAIMMGQMSVDRMTSMAMLSAMDSPLPSNPNRINADQAYPAPEPGSCPWPSYNCKIGKFRSHDGSCNNLQNPILGRSFGPHKRYVPADYGDGLQALRRARHGGDLPEARLVSFSINEDRDRPHAIYTVMLLQWGQFLDHDLTLTAISKMARDPSGYGETTDIECGDDGCGMSHPACSPITVPSNDPNFFGKKCLEFVRSEGVPNLNCSMGPREQLNQITSFIDASNLYGSTTEEADKLRDLSDKNRGRLAMTSHPVHGHKSLLPPNNEDVECKRFNSENTCFLAGDERVNEQNQLTVMHTMWVREHNRLEEQLHAVNPQWDGNTLYMETRRIIGAVMQRITFNEWLPVVLGQMELKKHGLELLKTGYYTGYDPMVDPRVASGFATAAMRFGHTLIQPEFERKDENQENNYSPVLLREVFFRPQNVYNTDQGGLDAFIRGLCGQNVQSYDRFVTKEVTTQLFSMSPPTGLGTDLVSLNIQRGRDHGIPGYNAWREWCGLRRATGFDDLVDIPEQEIRQKFRQLYRHVDDIDLFPAGLSERSVEGGLVGPTFACIIGRQMRDLRRGDRFWHENTGAYSFTEAQLGEIRKMSLAKVMCSNGDKMSQIQPKVMEVPFRDSYPNMEYSDEEAERHGLNLEWFSRLWMSDYNKRVDCDCLEDMNLTAWKE